MNLLTYTPLTPWQVELFRAYLPHIVAWLRTRESGAGVSPATERSK